MTDFLKEVGTTEVARDSLKSMGHVVYEQTIHFFYLLETGSL